MSGTQHTCCIIVLSLVLLAPSSSASKQQVQFSTDLRLNAPQQGAEKAHGLTRGSNTVQ